MEKKTKNLLAVIRKKQKDLQHKIMCVKQQNDEPGELKALETELATITSEAESLKNAWTAIYMKWYDYPALFAR